MTASGQSLNVPSANRQVWLLALLALGTTAVVLALVSMASLRMRDANRQLTVAQESFHELTVSLNLALSEAQREQLEWLEEQQPTPTEWSRSLDEALAKASSLTSGTNLLSRLGWLRQSVEDLKVVTAECTNWHRSHIRTRMELQAVQKKVEDILRELGAVATTVEGRLQLRNVSKTRRFRSMEPGAAANALAREIIQDRAASTTAGEVQAELATLAVSCERLVAETKIDQLANYKDNLFSASLMRLKRVVDRLAVYDPEVTAQIHPLREKLERALFGEDYQLDTAHQTIVTGSGESLYRLCQRRLELRHQRDLLRLASTMRLDEIRADEWELQATFNLAHRTLAGEVARDLGSNWRNVLIWGVVCGILLLVLARRIAATLNRQLATIQENNEALEASARAARQAAADLQRQEERTHRIVQTALDAVISMDIDGRILDWNAQAEITFGWSRAEALGQSIAELIIPPALREAHERGLERFRRTGEGGMLNRRIEVSALRKDGQEVSVELAITAIHSGEDVTFSAFLRDITARKQAEADLVRARDEAESANSLLQASLESAERLAEEAHAANKAKSEFLATMSHELRTPMNGVLGFTQLLLETGLDAEQEDFARTVKTSAESLLLILNDVLDFSKIEAGRLEVECKPCDVVTLAGEVARLLSTQIRAKKLAFDFRVPAKGVGLALADSSRVRQVLLNLAGNAVKFTQRGEVRIEVMRAELPARAPDGATRTCIQIRITDTGIGIPRSKHGQLFQKFTQADSSHSRRFGGTGLGLAISKRLVELMGGQIGFESEEGTGSVFWFSLPTVNDEAPESGSASQPGLQSRSRSPLSGPAPVEQAGRILVAEDNATNQILILTLLKKAGWQADLARNGLEAVAMSRERSYTSILMDCHMPEMDGFEAACVIRRTELEATRLQAAVGRIPIIALTASVLEEDRRRCAEAGMDDFIAKPVNLAELQRVLQRWNSTANKAP